MITSNIGELMMNVGKRKEKVMFLKNDVNEIELDTVLDGLGIENPYCKINLKEETFFSTADKAIANVFSYAHLTDENQEVKYYIKWDNKFASPGGNHLGQKNINQYPMDYIEDRDSDGITITDSNKYENYVWYNNHRDFFFKDCIEQNGLDGKWWFKIEISEKDNDGHINVLTSDEVCINWK